MVEYKKFFLSPGQQAPIGSLGKTLSDGGILYYGEDIPGEITSETLTLVEIKRYKRDKINEDARFYIANSRTYSVDVIMEILLTMVVCLRRLATHPEKASVIESRMKTVDPFLVWYRSVNAYKLSVISNIMNAATTEAVNVVVWDFSQFDNDDPNYIDD